jgi:hypothetical protein
MMVFLVQAALLVQMEYIHLLVVEVVRVESMVQALVDQHMVPQAEEVLMVQ